MPSDSTPDRHFSGPSEATAESYFDPDRNYPGSVYWDSWTDDEYTFDELTEAGLTFGDLD